MLSIVLSMVALSGLSQVGRPIPVLQGNPDARSAAMGGVMGAKTDRMYLFVSPGSIFFQDKKLQVDLSSEFFPKLEGIEGRTMQYNFAGAYNFGTDAVFLGYRYQGGTRIPLISEGMDNKELIVKPFDWSLDAGYAKKLGDNFSIHASANLIASWIGKGAYTGSITFGWYYQNEKKLGRTPAIFSFGMRLADLGVPVKYKSVENSIAVPSSLQIGSGLDMQLSAKSQLNFVGGARYFVLPKEASMLLLGVGTEYGFNDMLFARAGFEYGQRSQSFGTFGLGAKYQGFHLDAAYRLSTSRDFGLNTLLISLGYSF